ncbi:MAG: hypothetical protein J5772_04080 [Clostridia bacterium]|nr:hypothetical protein [Clostridia bacterium]
MATVSTKKTEDRALNALENIIDKHDVLEYRFNKDDKEMSWDGSISLYSINGSQASKKSFEGRIPVQIKGHTDPRQVHIKRDKISYPVDIGDLKAYSTEKGVLYFQIFISGNRREIFYSSLTPSKIADYLEEVARRDNTGTINIQFYKLAKQPTVLYNIVNQFNEDAKKQGSSFSPLVIDRIRREDINRISEFTFSAVAPYNTKELLTRIAYGDICLWGKTENDKYFRPVEWSENTVISIERQVDNTVSLGDEVFYESYKYRVATEGEEEILFSPNLKHLISKRQFVFQPVSTVKEISKDARFLLGLNRGNQLCVSGESVNGTVDSIPEDLKNTIDYFVELDAVLDMIQYPSDFRIANCTDKQQRQLKQLVLIHNGSYNSELPNENTNFIWEFGDTCVPLSIYRMNDGSNLLTNAIYSGRCETFLPSERAKDKLGFKVPMFARYDADVLSKLYTYDYNELHKQISESDVNELTSNALLEFALELINVYDINGDSHFLDLAGHMLDMLCEYIEDEIILLNRLQIKERRNCLEDEDIRILDELSSDNSFVLFGKSVLLKNFEQAERYYNALTSEDKKRYAGYPIYKLFERLKH